MRSAAATPATVHSDAARAGVCIRKGSSCGGAPGPVYPVAAGYTGLAGRDPAGGAGLLGHELLNKFLESSIHNYHPLGCTDRIGSDRIGSGRVGVGCRAARYNQTSVRSGSEQTPSRTLHEHCGSRSYICRALMRPGAASHRARLGAPSSYVICCSPAVGIMAGMAATGVTRVVVMVQENHTTDNYLRGLAPYGVNVATDWPIQPNPPASDQPHDRHAYYRWLSGQHTATHTQFDTDTVLPYYAYLALTGALLENHCSGFGTNSTPNHLLLVGGQTPTLRNPPRSQPAPKWDMPSVPGLASDHGMSWRCYTASRDYPVGFYTQLNGSANLVPSDRFVTDAAAGMLPRLCYLWHDSPRDEHPAADVTIGQNATQHSGSLASMPTPAWPASSISHTANRHHPHDGAPSR